MITNPGCSSSLVLEVLEYGRHDPRCSRPGRSVPMVVLASLTDPEVVSRILRHLGLPIVAPMLAPARRSGEAEGVEMGAGGVDLGSEEPQVMTEEDGPGPPIRPPP